MIRAPTHDVLIVGAGVAGALIADRLANAGVKVLLLEAGPEPSDRATMAGRYASDPLRSLEAAYADVKAGKFAPVPKGGDKNNEGHYHFSDKPFKSTYQRIVGGSTWHWLGNTPRFLPADFELEKRYDLRGCDWPISYQELERFYGEAEIELGVSGDHGEWNGVLGAERSTPFPMPPIWAAYGDHVVKAKIQGESFGDVKAEVRITPQARNSTTYQGRPPCAGNSSCVPLCPIGAKYDATVHVKRATAPKSSPGVATELRACSVAQKLIIDAHGAVEGVEYLDWRDPNAAKHDTAHARLYVIAAHAIETPLLLLNSGFDTQGPIGGYLMDHLQGYVGALLHEPVYPFRGPPVTSGIDAWRDGAFRSNQAAFRISIGNDGWGRLESPEASLRLKLKEGLTGSTLRQAVNQRITRMMRMSYSTEMLPETSNRVALRGRDGLGNPLPRIDFKLPDYNGRAFQTARGVITAMFEKIGAEKIVPSSEEYSGAGHIIGTCRMGTDPATSVVDRHCRAHGMGNLYLAGPAVFTTGGTANPTLTAAALALRLADALLQRLREG
jgi:glucose dehydrogenase